MNKPVKYVFILILLLFVARNSALAVNEMKSVWENGPEKEAPGFWSTLFSLQPMREKDPDEKRWYLTVGGWYERKLGNTDSMRANGSADLEYKSGIAVLLVSYQQFYSELNGDQFENNISGIIKYDHYLVSYLEYFIFNQAEFNDITGLRLRNGTGTGLKFVFFRNIYWTADISAAPVFEYQRIHAGLPRVLPCPGENRGHEVPVPELLRILCAADRKFRGIPVYRRHQRDA
jgi:hypothetical protein